MVGGAVCSYILCTAQPMHCTACTIPPLCCIQVLFLAVLHLMTQEGTHYSALPVGNALAPRLSMLLTDEDYVICFAASKSGVRTKIKVVGNTAQMEFTHSGLEVWPVSQLCFREVSQTSGMGPAVVDLNNFMKKQDSRTQVAPPDSPIDFPYSARWVTQFVTPSASNNTPTIDWNMLNSCMLVLSSASSPVLQELGSGSGVHFLADDTESRSAISDMLEDYLGHNDAAVAATLLTSLRAKLTRMAKEKLPVMLIKLEGIIGDGFIQPYKLAAAQEHCKSTLELSLALQSEAKKLDSKVLSRKVPSLCPFKLVQHKLESSRQPPMFISREWTQLGGGVREVPHQGPEGSNRDMNEI